MLEILHSNYIHRPFFRVNYIRTTFLLMVASISIQCFLFQVLALRKTLYRHGYKLDLGGSQRPLSSSKQRVAFCRCLQRYDWFLHLRYICLQKEDPTSHEEEVCCYYVAFCHHHVHHHYHIHHHCISSRSSTWI